MNTRKFLNFGITDGLTTPSRWLQLLAVAALVAIAGCEPPEEKVAQYIASAEQFFEEENLVKAELEAKNALQIEPKNADARYMLARIARAKRDFGGIVGNLLIVIESRPEFIEARTELGTIYVQAGEPELAEEQLVELEKFAPDHTETRLLRARLLASKGELEQAEVELRAAISAESDNIVAMGLLASLTAATDVDEALAIVDEAIAKTEDDRDLQLLKINILRKAVRSEAVEAAYRDLISSFPDEPQYRFMLAKFLADEGKIEDVADVLMAAVDHDPSDHDAKLTLVRFIAATRGAEESVALLQSFVEQNPAATNLRAVLAGQYLNNGDTKGAKAEFQKIVDAEGNEDAGLAAKARIAGIHISEGELEEGTVIVDEILAIDPLNAYANYLHGQVNFKQANWKGAVSDLRSALRETPNNLRAQWLLARTHAKAGDLILAKDAYRRLMEISPLNPAATLELTRVMVDQKEWKEAEGFLAEKITAMPLEADLSRARISLLIDLERFDDALAEAERLGSTEGNAAIGSYLSGRLHQSREQHGKAVSAFREALEAEPNAREPLQSLIASLVAQGKTDEARDYLESRTRQFPENLYMKTLLGQLLASTGEEGAAREVFEAALSDKSDWLPAYTALASMEPADSEAQIELYQRGLEAAPNNQQMALLLGSAYERGGEFEKAIATYEEALVASPDMPIVANNLAALLADYRQDQASFNRALEVARQLEAAEEPALLDTLGWVYYRLGEHDKAQRLLEKAVEDAPGVPVLNYHLGMNYLAQNKQQLAIEQLQAATENPDADYSGRDVAVKALAELLGTN